MEPIFAEVIATTPEQRFAEIVTYFRGKTGVTLPSQEPGQRKSFGSCGFKVKGRVFAMLSSDREFVVKLPRQRVDALVASGDGDRFDPRRNGQVMKEWIVIRRTSRTEWLQVAREAKDFVNKS